MKAPKSPFPGSSNREGSALMMAVITAAVIALGGAVTLSIVQSKYRAINQAAAWKESLPAAEAGVEMAMNEVRKKLFDPDHAWTGWTAQADETLFPQGSAPSPGTSTTPYSVTSSMLVHTGEGGQRSWARVTVDAPASLIDRSGEQW